MEKYEKVLRSRLRMLALYNVLLAAMVVLGLFTPVADMSDTMLGFISIANIGLFAAMQIMLIKILIKYNRGIRSKDELKRMYTAEYDERKKHVNLQVGSVGINIIIGGIMMVALAFGYINEIVYLTLLATLAFCLVVKVGLKLYFDRDFKA